MTAPLSVEQTAHRLGVKRETVYAYVSRGLLARDPSSTRRATRFAPEAVERLASRARHSDRSGALEVVVETELTALDPAGRLAYRGRDAIGLARHRSFEAVAGLLWDGDAHAPWTLPAPERRALARARSALPGRPPAARSAAPLEHPDHVDRIPLAVAVLAARDPERSDRRPEAVRRAGARMLAGALEMLDGDGDGRAAERLWRGLAGEGRATRPASGPAAGDGPVTGARRPRPAELAALDAALVLLADHELAASTLAARVAASTWADPYRVVLSGLGPLGGPLHGGAGVAAETLLAEAARLGPGPALDLRTTIPGFGHRVYRDRDPRADHLLTRLAALARSAPAAVRTRARTVHGVVDAAAARGLPAPNVDLALAGLVWSLDLAPGASATVFTLARMVGLVAHALEEYPHRLRFRPRATYVGPVPTD